MFQNNRALLAGDISLTLNGGNTIIAVGKKKRLPLTEEIKVVTAPQGPSGRLAPLPVTNAFMVWKFGKNIETAKRFLVDYIGQTGDRLLKSDFSACPAFPGSVPDYARLIDDIADVNPAAKYQMRASTDSWITHLGYPGSPNPAIAEIYNDGLIPTMFANATTGKMTSEEALTQADQKVRKIFDKWRALGKV